MYVSRIAQFCVIVAFFHNLEISSQWTYMPEPEDGCSTPDGLTGTCIPIKTCAHVLRILESSSKPYSQKIDPTGESPAARRKAIINLLRKYQCGFDHDRRSVNVCCPDTDQVTTTAAPPDPSAPPPPIPPDGDGTSPPDVSAHRNLGLMPPDCGSLDTGDKIIGGNKTALNEFPWMALISYSRGDKVSFRCGGTVINEKYILTAAHCVTHLGSLVLHKVRVGEHNIVNEKDCELNSIGQEHCAPPVQDFDMEKVDFHPLFNTTTLQNDIAIIRVAGKIDLIPENAKAICLPHTAQLIQLPLDTRNKVFVTGWGATEDGTRSDVLLKVRIPIRDHAECTRTYSDQVPVWHKQICAGGVNSQDSCGGDSGGPMQHIEMYNDDLRYIQFGVVSFGPKLCGLENSPGVYTSVRHYLDWILDHMTS